ncbi:hypothetical protein DMUE_1015 [Dictyocoela muelleri]|nr:hypothetical protein DMUE_1015 [Dictyocoela muelleri]
MSDTEIFYNSKKDNDFSEINDETDLSDESSEWAFICENENNIILPNYELESINNKMGNLLSDTDFFEYNNENDSEIRYEKEDTKYIIGIVDAIHHLKLLEQYFIGKDDQCLNITNQINDRLLGISKKK